MIKLIESITKKIEFMDKKCYLNANRYINIIDTTSCAEEVYDFSDRDVGLKFWNGTIDFKENLSELEIMELFEISIFEIDIGTIIIKEYCQNLKRIEFEGLGNPKSWKNFHDSN